MTLASCGGSVDESAADATVGSWAIDPAGTLAANQAQIDRQLAAIPKAAQGAARTQMEGMFKSVKGSVELKADKTAVSTTDAAFSEFTASTDLQAMRGTWERDGDKITIKSTAEGSTDEQVMTGTIEGDVMTVSVSVSGTDFFAVLKKGK